VLGRFCRAFRRTLGGEHRQSHERNNNQQQKDPCEFPHLFLLFIKSRQEVVPGILKQPDSRWSAIKPD
jgi:hypothetical protein